ncbi:MAG: hypothetical protein IJZ74_03025 [Clostridia bacterium]|nr:hypothetical protein [Clostridia bacterium]
MKTLIIYYSRKGRTAKIARKWAHKTGASRLAISPMAYRGTMREYLQYLICTLTRRDMELDLHNVDFSKYDRIVLMVPVICGMMSAPVRTFVRQEAGRLQNVEYVIVHKGFRARQPKMVRWLDKTLGVKHLACSSIHQSFNKSFKARCIDGQSILK